MRNLKISIRWALLAGFLGLIWGTHLITTTSAYLTSQNVLRRHARDIMENIAELALEQSQRHLLHAHGAAALTRRLLTSNVVGSGSHQIEALERYLREQLSVNPYFAGIYVGTPTGDFYDVRRDDLKTDGGYRTKVIVNTPMGRDVHLVYRNADFTTAARASDPNDTYDPRKRPWYQKAVVENRIVWTDPYIFYTSQKPGITIAGPFFDAAGELRGVVGVDIEIDQLSIFIGNLKIGKHGKAFMLNRNKDVVAFGDLEKLKYDPSTTAGGTRLVKIHELDDPHSRKAFAAAQIETDATTGRLVLNEPRFARFVQDGRVYHAMFTPFTTAQWPWITGVYLPEDDYLGAIKSNRLYNIMLTLVISLFAAFVAFLLARGVTRPIALLDQTSRRMQRGQSVPLPPIHSVYSEIRETANAFAEMKTAVERMVIERTMELQHANEGLRGQIEQRLAMEAQLRASEEKYRSILDAIEEAYFETDPSGTLVFVNDAACRIMAYTHRELCGMHFRHFSAHQPTREIIEAFRRMMVSGAPVRLITHPVITKQGQKKMLDLSAALIRNSDGDVVGVRGLARDITAQLTAQKEKEVLQAQLNHAQRMEAVGTLAGGIAHDFNNLLMGIMGNVSLLETKLDTDVSLSGYLRAIEQCVESGATLTRQLLGYARGGKYQVTTVSLNETVRRTTEMFGRTRKEIQLRTNYQKDIWPVEADQGQIDQVLVNLFVNAWQAMVDDMTLTVATANVILDAAYTQSFNLAPGRYVRVIVQDHGKGIPPENLPRIFEPFFTTKKMGRGTGLGLASVFGIVKNHGGIIDVTSEVGRGTVFSVYLPAATRKPETPPPPSPHRMTGASGTLLVVDDEPMILNTLTDLLKEMGYAVIAAGSGSEAVDIFQASHDRIDGVILDMIMPDMNGGRVLRRLRRINPGVKVILSSGYNLDGLNADDLESKGDGFIQKPYQIDQLADILTKLFRSDPASVEGPSDDQ